MKSNPLFQLASQAYAIWLKILTHGQGVVLLLVRLIWGFEFAQTGWGKWQDISRPIGYFTELGIPFPEFNAYLVATTELVGGICLILGLLSRLGTIPLIISMSVAYLTTEQEAIQKLFKGDIDPFLSADPFQFWFAAILILFFGPGYLALDSLIFKKFRSIEKNQE